MRINESYYKTYVKFFGKPKGYDVERFTRMHETKKDCVYFELTKKPKAKTNNKKWRQHINRWEEKIGPIYKYTIWEMGSLRTSYSLFKK